MKMGIKEFRERLSEVVHGEEPVLLTHHGRIVARVVPMRGKPTEKIDLDQWLADIETEQAAWRSRTPDWRERLAAIGLDANGEPLSH